MTELQRLLERLVERLDGAGIPFMIAGSFASTTHGFPRTTQDLDIVIAPPSAQALEAFVLSLPTDDYYVDLEAAHDALRRRAMFNVVDSSSGWRVGFIILKNRAFSREELNRRLRLSLLEVPAFMATPEDTIVAKLEWSKQSGGSERQRRDVAGIVATSGEQLDRAYVSRWVDELGLADEWAHAQKDST